MALPSSPQAVVAAISSTLIWVNAYDKPALPQSVGGTVHVIEYKRGTPKLAFTCDVMYTTIDYTPNSDMKSSIIILAKPIPNFPVGSVIDYVKSTNADNYFGVVLIPGSACPLSCKKPENECLNGICITPHHNAVKPHPPKPQPPAPKPQPPVPQPMHLQPQHPPHLPKPPQPMHLQPQHPPHPPTSAQYGASPAYMTESLIFSNGEAYWG